jgi:hypothetical protein
MVNRWVWRWMSFALPPDLLMAALPCRDPPRRVRLLSPQLQHRLKTHGFAETHLHIGAGLTSETVWVSAMKAVADPNTRSDIFCRVGRNTGFCLDRCSVKIQSLCATSIKIFCFASVRAAQNTEHWQSPIVSGKTDAIAWLSRLLCVALALPVS